MEIARNQAMVAFRALTQTIKFENEVNKYAASRNIKKLRSIAEDAEEYTQERRLKHCFKDKDQCPVKDEKGNMKFIESEEKKFVHALKEYTSEKIEFEPYQFRANKEMEKHKYFFINSDLEFLLDSELTKEPESLENKQNGILEKTLQ